MTVEGIVIEALPGATFRVKLNDEQEILTSIKDDLDNLNKQLMQILEDDLAEEEFRDICSQILEDIIINAQNVAKRDQVITDEEKKLLDRLSEFVLSEELFK